MPVTAFRDLSTSSKSLVLLELLVFMAGLLLAVNVNQWLAIADAPSLPTNVLFIYALVCALVLSFLAWH